MQKAAQPSGKDSATFGAASSGHGADQLTRRALAFVLAGGRGNRLRQMTDCRAKPGVLFGGRHCIIDFTLANCVNSDVRRIAVLTQYKAQGLIRHLQEHWTLNRRFGEFVDIAPAQQRTGQGWYEGTADAVYQNLEFVNRHRPDFVLVLGGDHVYKMDYAALLADHVASQAEVSVACVDVPIEEAGGFGVPQVDGQGRVIGWQEKPRVAMPLPGSPGRALASMGIYVFDAATLVRVLNDDAQDPESRHDFGHDVVPGLIRSGDHVHAHPFACSCVGAPDKPPYWRDVGTLDAYWEANIELTRDGAGCDLFDRRWPIPSAADSDRPTRFVADDRGASAVLVDTLIGAGCTIGAATIRQSVLFSDLRIGHGAHIEASLVLSDSDIGAGVTLRRTIVDRYCRLPPGLTVGFDVAQDRQRFHVTRRGITLITPNMLGQRALAARAGDRREASTPAVTRLAA